MITFLSYLIILVIGGMIGYVIGYEMGVSEFCRKRYRETKEAPLSPAERRQKVNAPWE
jgi:hypothetical protein